MEIDNSGPQISISVHDYEASSFDSDSESSGLSGPDPLKDFVSIGMVRLEQNQNEHNFIKKCFLKGMRFLITGTDVIAVHKLYSNPSVMGRAKKAAHRIFQLAVAAKRGGDDANVKYGWCIGGDRDEICDIVRFGFSKCGEFEKGVSHGVGVYLSSADSPIDCALRAKEDENGLRHILICSVILGNTETIHAGSEQTNPSSTNFDSGIDNPLAPRKYIIWSAYMNSHILPTHVITFRAPCLKDGKVPYASGVKLSVLFNALSTLLNPVEMGSIRELYKDLREYKIDRFELFRRLRSSVGDRILSSAMKLCINERV